MIYLYPANKMENLLLLLDKIQHISPLPIFSKDVVIVQNAGMQHWLNMSLAKQRGISMNIDYALPSQFLWKLVRSVASEEDVPDQSPFSREVLAWRIFALLAEDLIINDDDFSSATHYWMPKSSTEIQQINDDQHIPNFSNTSELKRYQLACQMADLFEQYLIFRPTWINDWEHGKFSAGLDDKDALNVAKWQGKLWYFLTREQSYNPIDLIEKAVAQLKNNTVKLPKRISFFGINIMAPMWLSFINELSEYVDVHFFHLNPCYAYWGDVITEKQAIKSIQQWVEGHDDISQLVGNPLLANLGQQGREFMALLHDYSTINIEAFEDITNDIEQDSFATPTVLQQVQHDILSLTDARDNQTQATPIKKIDNSIVISSCHSSLREVQGLHDWLLHQFNEHDDITPKDVLVMCPQVEDYAPYVNAVFARGWQDFDDKIPPLPCSIADRVSKDSEPMVAAFSDLLTLPDNRFQVSQLVSLLRVPAMRSKFSLAVEDIDKITLWLNQASIHWGLDKEHKANVLHSDTVTSSFTWQQGLSRLIQGFAFGDAETIYNDQLLLPTVEGNDGELLGHLMLILEQLQLFATQLSKARTTVQWQTYLNSMLNDLFDVDSDDGFTIIEHAIESLVEYCLHAKFDSKIDLLIVRDFLNQHFSTPEPGRQFMVGQVTFCSMLPMRSIPFKVIAILGLNDGLFPRQRQPLSFDLMSITPMKLGDRSRRGDDRYLFLEAIISARKALYLSYQGRNIKNNAPKQASLVLKELMEYLELGYGWNLSDEMKNGVPSHLRQLPMQPFSQNNYLASFKSFDPQWFKLSKKYNKLHHESKNESESSNKMYLPSEAEINDMIDHQFKLSHTDFNKTPTIELNLSRVISFFQHPSKAFAESKLNLFFQSYNIALDDVEPFDFDHLQTYLLREQLLDAHLSDADTKESLVSNALVRAKLSGKFPESIARDEHFDKLNEETRQFGEMIESNYSVIKENVPCSITLDIELEFGENDDKHTTKNVRLLISANLPVADNKLAFYRSSLPKAKDFLTLYIHQLILQLAKEQQGITDNILATQATATHGYYFDTKSQKVVQFRYTDIENPESKLTNFIQHFFNGLTKPQLSNGDIAEKAFKAKVFEQNDFEHYWSDPNSFMALGNDPYVHYFWPECPSIDSVIPILESLYRDMFTCREQIK